MMKFNGKRYLSRENAAHYAIGLVVGLLAGTVFGIVISSAIQGG